MKVINHFPIWLNEGRLFPKCDKKAHQASK